MLRALAKAVLGPFSTDRPHPDALLAAWHKTKRSVRELHDRIFYRPLLNTAAKLSSEDARLTPEAAQGRLAALGYRDPQGAMRHIEALTAGVSRRAALQRQLLPILLGWLAEGVDPDAGLLAFRRVSEALGTTHWYLGMLRDSTAAAERLCHVLSNSRLIADLLEVSPESVAWLGTDKDLAPLSFEAQWQEIASKMSRHADPESAMRLIRLIRRREILRVAIADSAGLLDQDQVGAALADTDRAAVLGALRVAENIVVRGGPAEDRGAGRGHGPAGRPGDRLRLRRRRHVRPPRACRAMPGGGGPGAGGPDRGPALQPPDPAAEAGHHGRTGAGRGRRPAARGQERRDGAVAGVLRRVLPPVVPGLGGAGAAAGPADGGRRRAGRGFRRLIDPIRYPESLSEEDVREVRRVKARVEAERLPRGADPARHLKLGRGGLSDVEWLVQLLQLQHAGRHPELRTTSTVEALDAAAALGLLAAADAGLLRRGLAAGQPDPLRQRDLDGPGVGPAAVLPAGPGGGGPLVRLRGRDGHGLRGGLPAGQPARPGRLREGLLRPVRPGALSCPREG